MSTFFKKLLHYLQSEYHPFVTQTMPFSQRIVTNREQVSEVFADDYQTNILQKTNVSNLMGLLSQLNKISLFAHDIFTDVLNTTSATSDRIQTAKKRLRSLETKLPSIESMFIQNAPSYFYDNPYSGKEYLRDDALNGLLFTREDALKPVNDRRNIAKPPADLSGLDPLSQQLGKGQCIKRFTDSDFFINEWLENEKRKREEERERRKLAKANRKKGKVKRKQNKTIIKLKRKHYDHQGNVIKDENESDVVAVTTYQLTDDNNRNFDALLKTNRKSKKKSSEKVAKSVESVQIQPPKVPSSNVPPPVPMNVSSPPPNPQNLHADTSHSKRVSMKLRSLSDDIPLDDVSTPPQNAASPKAIYAQTYQSRNLDDERLGLSNTSNIMATTPKEVAPVAPKLGFLSDITAFKEKGKLRRVSTVKRSERPKDQRSLLMDKIRGNKVKLRPKDDRKIEPKKEEKKNLIFEAMKHRRDFVGDSSSEEDSEWGSDSD